MWARIGLENLLKVGLAYTFCNSDKFSMQFLLTCHVLTHVKLMSRQGLTHSRAHKQEEGSIAPLLQKVGNLRAEFSQNTSIVRYMKSATFVFLHEKGLGPEDQPCPLLNQSQVKRSLRSSCSMMSLSSFALGNQQ